MNFKIGQKVVCVNARQLPNPHSNNNAMPLRENNVYIVSGIWICQCSAAHLDVGLAQTTNGVVCPCGTDTHGDIWWFRAERFAPLLEDEAEEAVNELLKSLNLETQVL